jgi:hypothetical protein
MRFPFYFTHNNVLISCPIRSVLLSNPVGAR